MKYTTTWTSKHVRIFTKAFNRAQIKAFTRSQLRTNFNAIKKFPHTRMIILELANYPKLVKRFLNIRGTSRNSLIRIGLGLDPIPRCPECGEVSPADNRTQGFCSHVCAGNSSKTKQKRIDTSLRKYGTSYPVQNNSVLARMVHTHMKRYGTSHPIHTKESKNKQARTMLSAYGGPSPFCSKEVHDKSQRTCLKNYGVSSPLQSDTVMKRRRNTCKAKYGTSHPMQNREVLHRAKRSAYESYAYVLGDRTVYVQGYEDRALDYVLSTGIPANCVYVNKVPSFEWVDDKNKTHVYHPDFRFRYKGKDIIVEVKSMYTLTGSESIFKSVVAKARAVQSAGYKLSLMVMTADGTRIKTPDSWMMSHKTARSLKYNY